MVYICSSTHLNTSKTHGRPDLLLLSLLPLSGGKLFLVKIQSHSIHSSLSVLPSAFPQGTHRPPGCHRRRGTVGVFTRLRHTLSDTVPDLDPLATDEVVVVVVVAASHLKYR